MIIRSVIREDILSFGDVVSIDDNTYLLCRHPDDNDEFYLTGFNGECWSSASMSEGEILSIIDDFKGIIYNKRDWQIEMNKV